MILRLSPTALWWVEGRWEAARQLEQEGVSAAVIDVTLKAYRSHVGEKLCGKTRRIVTCVKTTASIMD